MYEETYNISLILWVNLLKEKGKIPNFIQYLNTDKHNSKYFLLGWNDYFQNRLEYDTIDYTYYNMINKSNFLIKRGININKKEIKKEYEIVHNILHNIPDNEKNNNKPNIIKCIIVGSLTALLFISICK